LLWRRLRLRKRLLHRKPRLIGSLLKKSKQIKKPPWLKQNLRNQQLKPRQIGKPPFKLNNKKKRDSKLKPRKRKMSRSD